MIVVKKLGRCKELVSTDFLIIFGFCFFYWKIRKRSEKGHELPLSFTKKLDFHGLRTRSSTASLPSTKNGGWKNVFSYWLSVTFQGSPFCCSTFCGEACLTL